MTMLPPRHHLWPLCLLALLAFTPGCRHAADQAASDTEDSATASRARTPADDAEPLGRTYSQYSVISERNIFHPLIAAPTPPAAPAAATPPSHTSSGSRGMGGPANHDPTADLALTGVVQFGREPMALVENTKSGVGDFGGVGESLFGFTVVHLTAQDVTLRSRDGKEYTLAMGQKEIADTLVVSTPSAQPSAPATTSSSTSESSSDSERRSRFGFDPERMRRFLDSLPPERRAEMEQRMRERRGRSGRGGGPPR